MYKQKTTNILTKYGLPIKSDLISNATQWVNNATQIMILPQIMFYNKHDQ